MRPVYVFDRWGAMVDTIAWPIEFTHTDELGGEDSVDLTLVGTPLAKGQRLVWRDRGGEWHEHVVSDLSDVHSGGELYQSVHAENSISELLTDWLDEVEPQSVSAEAALGRCLSGTRWAAGTVTVTGTASFSWYHTSVHDALEEVIEAYGAEWETSVTVTATEVTDRRVNLLPELGRDTGQLFTFGLNLASVTREVSSDSVITALYGYGKSLPTSGGGQSRKLDFGSVNGGKEYVEDTAARAKYGLPDGRGGIKHAFGVVEFNDVEDASELKRLTEARLAQLSHPQVTYSCDAVILAQSGLERLSKGDTIHVRDVELDERITTRVLKVVSDQLGSSPDQITFGTIAATITGKVQGVQSSVSAVQGAVDDITGRSGAWDETSEIVDTAPGEWLQKVMDRINEEMDAAKTYKFTSFEVGDIWANGPLTADGKPTGNTSAAINLNGLGLRISSKVQGGEFVWTTFGTGEGFTANCINVGTLRCGDNYLNLDTGEMRIALTAKVGSGNTGISDYVQNVSNTAANNAKNQAIQQADANTQSYLEDYVAIGNFNRYLNYQNTFNALTHNGVDKGLFTQNNQLFINADFLRTGVIMSTNERSLWDLDTGYFETSSSGWSGGQFHNIYTRIAGGQYAVKMDNTDIGAISTFSQGNVHPFGIKVFTDLVFSAPGGIGVGYTATTQSGLNYTTTMRQGSITYVESVSGNATSVTMTRKSLSVMHGMITGTSTIANATFSTPVIEGIALAASVEPVSEIVVGGALPIERVNTTDELMAAADESRMVWQVEPETLELGVPVYTGEEWTMGVPTADQPEEEPIELPSVEYVEAQAQLIQSELETVVDSIGDATLKRKLATARVALASRDAKALARAVAPLRKAGEVTDA